MGDSINQEIHLNMNDNEQQKTGLEAEDIVADAIKLNVDEDLNEQRYDNSSEKSSNFQNGNQSLNIEDEPNYEIDENEEEEMNEHDLEPQNEYDEQICEDDNVQNNEKNSLNNDHNLKMDTTGNNDETSKKNKSDEKDDNSTLDKNKSSGKEDKNPDKSKITENKTESSHNDETSKKDSSKIDGNASESDLKATKSKSSSSKDKDRDRSADCKSNDKIVWVSGLSSSTKASDLQNLFKKYGKVVSAKIITNTKLPGSKIFGVITMESVEIVEKCIQKLNKTEFEGKTITVEKNRLEEKKDNKEESKKDEKSSKDKRDRSKSPRGRRSFSPIRRFPLPHHHRPSFPPRRGHAPFGGFRGRGAFGPRPPFMPGPPPGLIRKIEAERMFRKRELRAKERRRAEENYRRQRELERRQHEEREKLEREKLRIKIERERLEREKAEFLRAEREKARLERERIEREREELRRKIQLPDSRNRGNLTPNKRFDDFVSTSTNWDFDRKPRFSSSSGASLTTRYDDLDNGLDSRNNLTNFSYNLLPTADLIDRRKLDASLAPISNSRDTYDMKPPSRLSDLNARSGSGSYDRGDDRRQSANGSRRNDRDEWKRTDIRFLDKNSLTQSASQSSYLGSSSTRTSNYERTSDSWASAPDRMPPASSLNKFSSYAQVSGIADRARVQPNLTPNVVGSAIFQASNIPMGGMISNTNYSSNLSGSGHRRY